MTSGKTKQYPFEIFGHSVGKKTYIYSTINTVFVRL